MWPQTVRKTDLEVTYYRGSGPGGQHKNKKDTACRIKHIPTGLSACCEELKSQDQNRQRAFKRLADKLIPIMLEKNRTDVGEVFITTEVIRTYNDKRGTVKDHRTKKTAPLKKVLNGNLDLLK